MECRKTNGIAMEVINNRKRKELSSIAVVKIQMKNSLVSLLIVM